MTGTKTVAVVFAGGGITGYFFEAGSVRAMLDCGLPLSRFSGISAGAAVAALAAHGLNPDEFSPFKEIKPRLMKNFKKSSVLLYGLLGSALMARGSRYKESLYKIFFRAPKALMGFEELEKFFRRHLYGDPRELYITATNIDTGELKVFTERDDVPLAVRASCSLPGIADPPVIDGHHYVDALVSCCANLDVVADSEIIVCVNPIVFNEAAPGFTAERGIFKIFDQSFRLLNSRRLHHDLNKISSSGRLIILIEPKGCETMAKNPLRRDLRAQALQSGYDFTLKKLIEYKADLEAAGILISLPTETRDYR